MQFDISTLPALVPRVCEQCAKRFNVPRKVIARAIRDGQKPRPYCTQECYRGARNARLVSRFWSKVTKTEGCWVWNSYGLPSGYGVLSVGTSGKVLAHRFSYELHFGPIPDTVKVCHRCDNPPCVRAECDVLGCQHLKSSEGCKSHLFLGTDADNHADMREKKRNAFGARHSNAKLTDEQVRDIRSRYRFHKVTAPMLAKEFNVSPITILRIAKRERWRHVD